MGLLDPDPTRDTQDNVYKALLENREVWLAGDIDSTSVFQVITEIQVLTKMDPKAPIILYINSPGGSVYDGCGLMDIIKCSPAPVHTVCMGHAMSMAAHILSAGEPGHRYITPTSTVMIHQVSSITAGKTDDMEVSVEEMKRLEDLMNKQICKDAGVRMTKLKKDTVNDFYLSATDAIVYGRKGLADKIYKGKA